MHLKKGFTLLEMLIAIAIVAILLSIALPSMQSLMQDNNATTASNKIQKALLFARNQSSSTLNNITICPLNNTTSCTNNWITGIDIFIDLDGDGDLDSGDDYKLVSGKAFNSTDTLSGPSTHITFSPSGEISGSSDLQFKYCSGEQKKSISLY